MAPNLIGRKNFLASPGDDLPLQFFFLFKIWNRGRQLMTRFRHVMAKPYCLVVFVVVNLWTIPPGNGTETVRGLLYSKSLSIF